MGLGVTGDCADCAPLRVDGTLEGFGNDDAPFSIALDGLAAKARLLAPASSIAPTDELLIVGADGKLKVAPSTLAGIGGTAPDTSDAVVNGNLDIWQYGFGPFTASGYTADQWQLINGVGAANALYGSNHMPGKWPMGRYFASWNRTLAGSTGSRFVNVVEDVRSYAGDTVTLSFSLTSSVAMDVIVDVEQIFGTGGPASPSVTTTAPDLIHVAGPESDPLLYPRYSVTLTVPDIKGKTLGSDVNDCLRVGLRRDPAQPNGWLYVWGLHIDVGSEASGMPRVNLEDTVTRCLRFLNVESFFFGQGQAYFNAGCTIPYPFPALMRKTPVFQWLSPVTGAIDVVSVGPWSPTSIAADRISHRNARLLFGGPATLTPNVPVSIAPGFSFMFDARL